MANSEYSIQNRDKQANNSLTAKSTTIEGLSTRLVNIVIIFLVVFAYMPVLLDARFFDSMPRFISSIVLGVLYGLLSTTSLIKHDLFGIKNLGLFIYFGLQFAILTGIFLLGRDFNNNYWLLMLPIAAQGISLGLIGAFWIGIIEVSIFWGVHWAGSPFDSYDGSLFSMMSGMTFTVLFTMIAFREQDARIETERLARDLQTANHRLAEYAAQVEELATVRERNRLARDIHDNLGHYLTVVNVQIEAARTVMASNPEKAQNSLEKAQKLTQEGLSSVRKSVSALRESPLAERPLPEAINQLIEENQATGIVTNLNILGTPRQFDPKVDLTLYRTVQESLTNIRKHANASQAEVILDYTNSNLVQLSIEDNGVGAENTEGGFGLLGLHERIQLLGGQIDIKTNIGQGLTLTVQIPTKEENQHDH